MSYILTYELIDDPGTEHEVEIKAEFDDSAIRLAARHMGGMAGAVLWASLTNHQGAEVASSWELL